MWMAMHTVDDREDSTLLNGRWPLETTRCLSIRCFEKTFFMECVVTRKRRFLWNTVRNYS